MKNSRGVGIVGVWLWLAACGAAAGADLRHAQEAAAHDLLLANSLPDEAATLRHCGRLPRDKRLRDALMYAADDTPVAVAGLTHGVSSLPAGLLRFAYCVPAPPRRSDTVATLKWLQGFSRDSYNADIQILLPTPCVTGVVVPPPGAGVLCFRSSTGVITNIRGDDDFSPGLPSRGIPEPPHR
jgi:hypothetical protein